MKSSLIIFFTLVVSICAYGQEKDIKIMSYNILNGFDWGKDTVRMKNLSAWIKEQNPDVIALQELCNFNPKKLEQLAKGWGHNHVLILKEDGYPVGLTSNKPIGLKEKVLDGLWHGMLHCTTWGIDFYVIHLSPADWQFRRNETQIIAEKIMKGRAENEKCIVLGDFNAHSPFDGDFDIKYPYQLTRSREGDLNSDKYQNLRDGAFDYSVIAAFLALPLMDVCQRYVPMDERTTCPTPINVPQWLSSEEMKKTRSRIDYILVSPSLDRLCVAAAIFNQSPTQYLSDHYPVAAVFRLN